MDIGPERVFKAGVSFVFAGDGESFAFQELPQESAQLSVVVDQEDVHGLKVAQQGCEENELLTHLYIANKRTLRPVLNIAIEVTSSMTKRLVKFAMAGALVAGLALAQTPQAAAGPAQAGPAGKVKAKGLRGTVRHRMMKALNLTPAQKEQAKQIFQQSKKANEPLRAQMQQNRQALAAAIKANDVGQIRQLTQVQGNLRGQMMASRSEGMAKFYGTLTPDQKAKADQIQQKVKKHVAAIKAARTNKG
jgi:Spy/CpxP family protein refolding chaperone